MARVLRPLVQLPRWLHRQLPLYNLLSLHSPSPRVSISLPFFASFSISSRAVHFRSRAIKFRDITFTDDGGENGDVSSSDNSAVIKSRNEKKREARNAVRWGMELASFSPPQIKRILRVAAIEQEVFDALMLVKRLGRDVKEGKRRQFNYIGKLLRDVEPELMDGLIQATKDGDQSKFRDLSGGELLDIDGEEDEEIEGENEVDSMKISLADRWYDGLINKDVSITNAIYSLHEIEFDRQELRQLVRKVHSSLENQASSEENTKPDAAALKSKKLLTHFLHGLVKQLPSEYSETYTKLCI